MISSVREGEMRAKHGEDCQECSRRDCRPCQQPVETALDRRRRTDQPGITCIPVGLIESVREFQFRSVRVMRKRL